MVGVIVRGSHKTVEAAFREFAVLRRRMGLRKSDMWHKHRHMMRNKARQMMHSKTRNRKRREVAEQVAGYATVMENREKREQERVAHHERLAVKYLASKESDERKMKLVERRVRSRLYEPMLKYGRIFLSVHRQEMRNSVDTTDSLAEKVRIIDAMLTQLPEGRIDQRGDDPAEDARKHDSRALAFYGDNMQEDTSLTAVLAELQRNGQGRSEAATRALCEALDERSHSLSQLVLLVKLQWHIFRRFGRAEAQWFAEIAAPKLRVMLETVLGKSARHEFWKVAPALMHGPEAEIDRVALRQRQAAQAADRMRNELYDENGMRLFTDKESSLARHLEIKQLQQRAEEGDTEAEERLDELAVKPKLSGEFLALGARGEAGAKMMQIVSNEDEEKDKTETASFKALKALADDADIGSMVLLLELLHASRLADKGGLVNLQALRAAAVDLWGPLLAGSSTVEGTLRRLDLRGDAIKTAREIRLRVENRLQYVDDSAEQRQPLATLRDMSETEVSQIALRLTPAQLAQIKDRLNDAVKRNSRAFALLLQRRQTLWNSVDWRIRTADTLSFLAHTATRLTDTSTVDYSALLEVLPKSRRDQLFFEFGSVADNLRLPTPGELREEMLQLRSRQSQMYAAWKEVFMSVKAAEADPNAAMLLNDTCRALFGQQFVEDVVTARSRLTHLETELEERAAMTWEKGLDSKIAMLVQSAKEQLAIDLGMRVYELDRDTRVKAEKLLLETAEQFEAGSLPEELPLVQEQLTVLRRMLRQRRDPPVTAVMRKFVEQFVKAVKRVPTEEEVAALHRELAMLVQHAPQTLELRQRRAARQLRLGDGSSLALLRQAFDQQAKEMRDEFTKNLNRVVRLHVLDAEEKYLRDEESHESFLQRHREKVELRRALKGEYDLDSHIAESSNVMTEADKENRLLTYLYEGRTWMNGRADPTVFDFVRQQGEVFDPDIDLLKHAELRDAADEALRNCDGGKWREHIPSEAHRAQAKIEERMLRRILPLEHILADAAERTLRQTRLVELALPQLAAEMRQRAESHPRTRLLQITKNVLDLHDEVLPSAEMAMVRLSQQSDFDAAIAESQQQVRQQMVAEAGAGAVRQNSTSGIALRALSLHKRQMADQARLDGDSATAAELVKEAKQLDALARHYQGDFKKTLRRLRSVVLRADVESNEDMKDLVVALDAAVQKATSDAEIELCVSTLPESVAQRWSLRDGGARAQRVQTVALAHMATGSTCDLTQHVATQSAYSENGVMTALEETAAARAKSRVSDPAVTQHWCVHAAARAGLETPRTDYERALHVAVAKATHALLVRDGAFAAQARCDDTGKVALLGHVVDTWTQSLLRAEDEDVRAELASAQTALQAAVSTESVQQWLMSTLAVMQHPKAALSNTSSDMSDVDTVRAAVAQGVCKLMLQHLRTSLDLLQEPLDAAQSRRTQQLQRVLDKALTHADGITDTEWHRAHFFRLHHADSEATTAL